MKVLVIITHPNPESFNHAILGEFTRGLKDGGHDYEVVDLYAANFDPRVNIADLAQFSGGQVSKEALDQQQKLASADAFAFIHPMWGWSFPAILKGWIDRVFSDGFAYKASEKGFEGLLKHNKVLVISTAGAMEEFYKSAGLDDAFRKTGNADLNLCGIQDVQYNCFYGIQAVGDEGRKKYLETAYRLGKEF